MSAGMYTLLSVPKDIEIFFPMAALLGALLGSTTSTRSELVVMQASGYTRLQIAGSAMKTAIPLVLLTMAIGEWVAPQGRADGAQPPRPADVRQFAALHQSGLWAKDGNDFIAIERVSGDKELSGNGTSPLQRSASPWRRCAMPPPPASRTGWWQLQCGYPDLTDPKQVTGTQTLTGEWENQPDSGQAGVVALDRIRSPSAGCTTT
ncbi:LptF/LptG family permease [Serratia ureilytica]